MASWNPLAGSVWANQGLPLPALCKKPLALSQAALPPRSSAWSSNIHGCACNEKRACGLGTSLLTRSRPCIIAPLAFLTAANKASAPLRARWRRPDTGPLKEACSRLAFLTAGVRRISTARSLAPCGCTRGLLVVGASRHVNLPTLLTFFSVCLCVTARPLSALALAAPGAVHWMRMAASWMVLPGLGGSA